MSERNQNSIVYFAIFNDEDEAILLRNFNSNTNEELNFQLNAFASLDQIEATKKKAQQNVEMKTPLSSFLGCVNSVYLAEDEFDIYGFVTPGELKMVAILRQKSLASYEEKSIAAFMSEVHTLYRQDILNPFNDSIDSHLLSKKFHTKLNSLVNRYQEILKKSV